MIDMGTSTYNEEHIIGILRQAEAGMIGGRSAEVKAMRQVQQIGLQANGTAWGYNHCCGLRPTTPRWCITGLRFRGFDFNFLMTKYDL